MSTYLPTQNLENIRSVTSSLTLLPVNSASASSAASASVSTASGVSPALSASRAAPRGVRSAAHGLGLSRVRQQFPRRHVRLGAEPRDGALEVGYPLPRLRADADGLAKAAAQVLRRESPGQVGLVYYAYALFGLFAAFMVSLSSSARGSEPSKTAIISSASQPRGAPF